MGEREYGLGCGVSCEGAASVLGTQGGEGRGTNVGVGKLEAEKRVLLVHSSSSSATSSSSCRNSSACLRTRLPVSRSPNRPAGAGERQLTHAARSEEKQLTIPWPTPPKTTVKFPSALRTCRNPSAIVVEEGREAYLLYHSTSSFHHRQLRLEDVRIEVGDSRLEVDDGRVKSDEGSRA